MKWILAIGGMVLVAVPGSVAAKSEAQEHLEAIVACGSVAESEARLLCFDQAIVTVKTALDQGRIVLEDVRGPRAMGGVVKASGIRGENRFWIELENGDRWLLLPTTNRGEAPRPGTTVKLRKGLLTSGYWISGDGWQDSRADFLGHAR